MPEPDIPPQPAAQGQWEYTVTWRGREYGAGTFGIGACVVGAISLVYAACSQSASASRRGGEALFGIAAVIFGILCIVAPQVLAR